MIFPDQQAAIAILGLKIGEFSADIVCKNKYAQPL